MVVQTSKVFLYQKMDNLNFQYIFNNVFDTFKVFETIPIELGRMLIEGHSKSIWQTLNHLIV